MFGFTRSTVRPPSGFIFGIVLLGFCSQGFGLTIEDPFVDAQPKVHKGQGWSLLVPDTDLTPLFWLRNRAIANSPKAMAARSLPTGRGWPQPSYREHRPRCRSRLAPRARRAGAEAAPQSASRGGVSRLQPAEFFGNISGQ